MQSSSRGSQTRTVRPAVAGDAEPRIDVAVVVEAGHDDLVAGRERRRDRTADVERQRRHVRAELDLGRVGRAEHVGHRLVRLGDDRVAPAARQERPVGVRVRLAVVGGDGVDDRIGDLRPAGTVEVGDGPAVVLEREGREAVGEAPRRRRRASGNPRLGWVRRS